MCRAQAGVEVEIQASLDRESPQVVRGFIERGAVQPQRRRSRQAVLGEESLATPAQPRRELSHEALEI
jgi:hypothetical protein